MALEQDSINFTRKIEKILPTEVTFEDIKNGVEDEYGVIYSGDGKRLLKAPNELEGDYRIKEGTICIGNFAFDDCSSLTSITIPNSVTSIGNYAFYKCSSLTSIIIPRGTLDKFKTLINNNYYHKYLKEL